MLIATSAHGHRCRYNKHIIKLARTGKDGFNIVVEGVSRFRLDEFTQEEPFFCAKVGALVDEGTGDAEASFARDDEAIEVEPISPDGEQFCWSFQPEIRRSVVIGDNLYTVSDTGIAVNEFGFR